MFFIIENSEEHETEILEAQCYAIKTAVSSILQGKDIKLFGTEDEDADYRVVDEETYKREKKALVKKIKAIGGDINGG